MLMAFLDQRDIKTENSMCVSLKLQLFSMLLSYHGCATLEWVDLPQKVEAPPPPSITEFWAEQIESTDPNEDGARVYIFKNPATGRKMDAVGACPETGPETRDSGGNTELRIIQTIARKLSTFSVSCKKPTPTG
jgi:hypothetical protein